MLQTHVINNLQLTLFFEGNLISLRSTERKGSICPVVRVTAQRVLTAFEHHSTHDSGRS